MVAVGVLHPADRPQRLLVEPDRSAGRPQRSVPFDEPIAWAADAVAWSSELSSRQVTPEIGDDDEEAMSTPTSTTANSTGIETRRRRAGGCRLASSVVCSAMLPRWP